MNKKLLTFTVMSLSLLSLAACESGSWYENKAPGTYKSTSKSTNAYGTKTKTDQTTHVYRDTDGNKKAVVETETTSDPKGLFNKETTKTTKSYN